MHKRHLLFRATLSAWIHANIGTQSAVPGITDAVLFVCGAKRQVCSGAGGRYVGWQVHDCACWYLCKIFPLHCYLMHVCVFVCGVSMNRSSKVKERNWSFDYFTLATPRRPRYAGIERILPTWNEWYCTDNATNVCWRMLTHIVHAILPTSLTLHFLAWFRQITCCVLLCNIFKILESDFFSASALEPYASP